MSVAGKWIVAVGVALVVSGCQSVPQGSATAPAAQLGGTVPSSTDDRQVVRADAQAADLRVFLADVQPRPGWAEISLKPKGVLYVQTAPVISRSDLIGIQSATDQSGGGILILALNDEGLRKLHAATAANPGLRLALVVGHTMLAAPGYAAPIREKQLAFGVGSRRNAEIAARAVAGVGSASPPDF
ncbi:hypothetical protein [Castellaniella sp. GW247-6E4]|uniref:hypothetical protein n=1 Tax=Castellaniella sp. GW247-6E4 TaxID=3140380 RepID=UPI003315B267